MKKTIENAAFALRRELSADDLATVTGGVSDDPMQYGRCPNCGALLIKRREGDKGFYCKFCNTEYDENREPVKITAT